jgi:pimeloyl-ACP methyl ester carboxylesterase
MVTNRVARIMLVVFEESGHYPFIEEPGAFWAEVRTFLDAL